MIERILPTIVDTTDYVDALALLRADGPLTKPEADKLLDIYKKYLPGADDEDYLKLCIAVDMLPGRGADDEPDFAAIGLHPKSLGILFAAKQLISGTVQLLDVTQRIEELVGDEEIPLPERVLLARVALDCMAASDDYFKLRGPIMTLAAFLRGVETERLDRCTSLLMEVKAQCRI